MRKILVYVLLIFIVITLFESTCGRRNPNNKEYDSKYNTRGESPKPNTYSSTNGIDENTTSRRGLGLSAWGIVTVVVSIILAIAGMYYFSICYPVMCQKNKKYDIMGLTPA